MKNSYRDMRHYANTMLLWKYYEYVSMKFFKIAMQKTVSKKEEILRLSSDSLRFFQSSFSEFFT